MILPSSNLTFLHSHFPFSFSKLSPGSQPEAPSRKSPRFNSAASGSNGYLVTSDKWWTAMNCMYGYAYKYLVYMLEYFTVKLIIHTCISSLPVIMTVENMSIFPATSGQSPHPTAWQPCSVTLATHPWSELANSLKPFPEKEQCHPPKMPIFPHQYHPTE